jgi:hypothetical protein
MHYPILGYTFSIASSTAVQVAQMVERGAWDIFTALLAGLVVCPFPPTLRALLGTVTSGQPLQH